MPASIDIAELKRRMVGAVDALKHDLVGLRAGRASTALLDPVQVEIHVQLRPVEVIQVQQLHSAQFLDGGLAEPWKQIKIQKIFPSGHHQPKAVSGNVQHFNFQNVAANAL